ncbi:MAG TPA: carbon storage regulator [Candidatus Angelobacter sp.]|nr:carbon storage regulator [Candidatus Angelobacter sp.]
MLVLARGVGQSVVLDGRITITVLATRGGVVRIGIEAPGDVGVRRGELAPQARTRPTAVGPAAERVPRPPHG